MLHDPALVAAAAHHYNEVEDGVEHYDNERMHEMYGQVRPYGQFLQ